MRHWVSEICMMWAPDVSQFCFEATSRIKLDGGWSLGGKYWYPEAKSFKLFGTVYWVEVRELHVRTPCANMVTTIDLIVNEPANILLTSLLF